MEALDSFQLRGLRGRLMGDWLRLMEIEKRLIEIDGRLKKIDVDSSVDVLCRLPSE